MTVYEEESAGWRSGSWRADREGFLKEQKCEQSLGVKLKVM